MSKQYKMIHCRINGKDRDVMVDVRASLTDMLRNDFRLTSVKKGCEVGECGACNVLINGECFNSCIYLAVWADGKDILTLEGLEKNAQKFGFRVQERNDLYSSEHNVAGLRATREAMKWIFDAKAGEVSPLYECGNNDHLLVIALTNVHPEGYRALESVKEQLKMEVIRDKKFEKAAAQLAGVKDIAAAKQKGAVVDSVRQITFSAPVFVQAAGASEPALSGAVAAAKQGQFSPAVIKGNGGAYLFQVLSKKQREGAKFDEKQQMQMLKQQAQQAAGRFMNEMYLKADVVDNRYLFF